jgi:uncharacterized phiE125 gp8 family phage protein
MDYRITTPITTEPLTLAEVKAHLRLDSSTYAGGTATYQSIAPGSHAIAASYGLTGASVEVLGKEALVNLNMGACGTGGSVTAKIQESDEGTHWSDFAAFATVTETNDNAVQEKEYTGGKRYIRVVATVAGAACAFSADVVTKSGEAAEDALLTSLITVAREYCEGYLWRALATQTIEAYPARFPCCNCIELPRPPLQSVTSIQYKDSSGTETTMTEGTDYIVDADSNVGRIVLPNGKLWPVASYPVNPIKIVYVAGYCKENPIPISIKQAMLLLIGHWYANREAVGAVGGAVDFSVKSLLCAYKVR